MAILLLGLLTALVCLLLLFVPFVPPRPGPGDTVRYLLIDLLDGQGLIDVRMRLYNRFIPVIAVLFVLALAVPPWWPGRPGSPGGRDPLAGRADPRSPELGSRLSRSGTGPGRDSTPLTSPFAGHPGHPGR